MEESKVHIDDLFRNKEQPFVALPAAAWDDMKLRLDQNQPKNGFLNRWIWYVLLSILILSAGFYFLRSHPMDQKNTGNTFSSPTSYQENNKGPTAQIIETSNIKQRGIQKMTLAKAEMRNKNFRQERIASETPLSKADRNLPQNVVDKNAVLPAAVFVDSEYINPKRQTTKDRTAIAPLIKKVPETSYLVPAISPVHSLINLLNVALFPVTVNQPVGIPIANQGASFLNVITKPEFLSQHNNTTAHVINDAPTSSLLTVMPKSNDDKSTVKEIENRITANHQTSENDSSSIQKNKRRLPLAFGFKVGYEAGTSKPSLNKLLVAPYLQYHLNNRFSLTLQPTIKYGTFVGTISSKDENYYMATGNAVDSQTITKNGHPFWQITYTHNYDSITVKYKPAGNTIEAEVPLILHYHLKTGIFFDAGLDLTFGKLILMEEQKEIAPMSQTAVFQIEKAGTHPAPDTSNSFHHSVPPFSEYVVLEPTAVSPLRVGYLIGIGYEHRKWILEGYVQQNMYGLAGITQPDIKKAYQIPYVHFMLGYRLSKK